MNNRYPSFASVILALGCLFQAAAQPADPGWPRVFNQGGISMTVYQPQVDYWHGFTNLHFRCAIAVKGVSKQERFGVAEVDALTIADQSARIAAVVPMTRDVRFGGVQDPELTNLRQAVDQLCPLGQASTLSLDRVLAYLKPSTHSVQPGVELNLDPPKIFSSTTSAILVMFMGEPQFKPIETNRTDLLFALNTNWDLLYDTESRQYYLLDGGGWLTTMDWRNGPWVPAKTLPPSIYSLPNTENWAEARARLPGTPPKVAPTVFIATQPSELILLQGAPSFIAVTGTRLLRVNNTSSVLFLNSGDGKYYYLVAGRWFRGDTLSGPWSAASANLPADFAQIPDTDPAAFVKASVPGTRQAKDAVLLASIPKTTVITITNVTEKVVYNGSPQFVPITNTVIQYAVNTPCQVLLVNGNYYWCSYGIWYQGASAIGPWSFCTSVPAVIYTIPPSSPLYNVTYVTVQSATPTTVVYSQTAGYSGQYVAATGVLMFGAGMALGAALAHNDCYYYYPPYACHYSYGWGACYHYGYGGYYSCGGGVYGPYGGAGYGASYNPSTGTYSRSAYAYGPYGSASAQRTYNPYTGTSTASRQVNTAYGSASRSAAYNAQTGARAAGGQVSTAYGSAGRAAAYNPTTGQAAAGGYRSGQYGTAGAARTTSGGAAAAWNTQNGEGAVGKSASGDLYASNGSTVYKKNSNGNWSENSGSGWTSVQSPQQQAQAKASSYQQQHPSSTYSGSSSWGQDRQNVESDAQSRSWGNQQHESTQSWRDSDAGRSWGGGGSDSWGGGDHSWGGGGGGWGGGDRSFGGGGGRSWGGGGGWGRR